VQVAPQRCWLSVLVPVYNVAPYLRQCVESVLAGADNGLELLLLDDASTDASLALMHTLQAEHGARIRLLQHGHNQGLSAARNSLLEAAQGEHVWFIDSDDWIAPAALPTLKRVLDGANPPDMVFFDYRVVRGRDRLKYRLRGEHHRRSLRATAQQPLAGGTALLEAVLASGNLFAWAHVSRRSLWQQTPPLRFPVGRHFEDMATTPLLALRAASAWYEAEPWVMYRRRDDSISALMSAAKVADLSLGVRGHREVLLRRFPNAPTTARVALAHQAARNLLSALRHARQLPAEEAQALARRAGEDFHVSVGDDLALLQRSYLARGWWWRAWRLAVALRLCATAAAAPPAS
jgi:Glycosyl transferase family 2